MKIVVLFAFCFAFSVACFAQETGKINHLTVEENDLVTDTQEFDKRMAIYIKILDRRFLVLNGASETVKEKKKEKENWGALPTGTRTELLEDVKSVLDEAVTKIDDAAERDSKNPLLMKGLKILAEGCARFDPQLKTLFDKSKEERDRRAAFDSIETCKEVIAAQSRLSAGK